MEGCVVAKNNESSVVNGTTDREACSKQWYAAQVRSCCEKKIAEKISSMGYETYLPVQEEIRQWSDRRKKIQKILIPLIVFVRADVESIKIIEKLSYVYGMLKAPGANVAAIIPEVQINQLKFILKESDNPVQFVPGKIIKSDRVKVVRGRLAGLEGVVERATDGSTSIIISIDMLGGAKVSIAPTDLQLIER